MAVFVHPFHARVPQKGGGNLRKIADMVDVPHEAEANVLSWTIGPSSDDDQIEKFTPSNAEEQQIEAAGSDFDFF